MEDIETLSSRIIQIIPNSNSVTARYSFKDGRQEDYPVVSWGLREEVTKWGDDDPCTDYYVVGLIIQQGGPFLMEVDSDDGEGKFAGYYY